MYRNDKKVMEKNNEVTPSATLLGHSTWSLRCAISGDGSTAISGDGKPSARTWNLNELSDNKPLCNGKLGIRQCALNHDGSATVVAGTGSKSSVAIFDTKTSEKLFEISIPHRGMIPAGCALSPDGAIVAATFRATNRSKGAIRIVRWKAETPKVMEIDRSYSVWQIYLSSDARRVAYKFWHGTTSGIEMVDPWNDRLFFNLPMPSSEWAFSMNSSASIIVTASEWSLRVIPTDDPDAVTTLPGYTFSAFAHCSVSADGTYVVAPIRDHKFGVWHIPSSTLVHVLVGHSNRTNGCSITSDGHRVITCSNDRSVRLWDLNHSEGKTAISNTEDPLLVKSLKLMLDGRYKFSLTSETIESILISDNVHTTLDLLFAHTMILITKRTRDTLGINNLPDDQIQEIYGSVVGKLHSTSEAFLAQLIMLHAEANDLIPTGFAKKGTGNLMSASKQMIEDLKTTIMRCWRLVSNLPSTMRHEKMEPILVNQLNSVYDEIDSVRSGDHVMIYCAIARCSLFFHPEFLTTLEDFTFGITGTIPTDALLRESKLTGLSFLEKLCPFDISSPKVLKSLISRDFISVLSPKSKRCVLSAMSRSYFQNENIAQAYLQDLLGLKLYVSTRDEFFDGKRSRPDKSTKEKKLNLENPIYASPSSSLDTESGDSISSASILDNEVPKAHQLKEMTGVWEKRAFDSPEVDPVKQTNEMRQKLDREANSKDSPREEYLKSIHSDNESCTTPGNVSSQIESDTKDGNGKSEVEVDDFEDNLILKVESEKSLKSKDAEDAAVSEEINSPVSDDHQAVERPIETDKATCKEFTGDGIKQEPEFRHSIKQEGEEIATVSKLVTASSGGTTDESETYAASTAKNVETRTSDLSNLDELHNLRETSSPREVSTETKMIEQAIVKESGSMGQSEKTAHTLQTQKETYKDLFEKMRNFYDKEQEVTLLPVRSDGIKKSVGGKTEASNETKATSKTIEKEGSSMTEQLDTTSEVVVEKISKQQADVVKETESIAKNSRQENTEASSEIVLEQVGMEEADLQAVQGNRKTGGSPPQVMNVNVFIMTEEQKVKGQSISLQSDVSNMLKAPETQETTMHEVETVPVTVIKSVDSQGSSSNSRQGMERAGSLDSSNNGAASTSHDDAREESEAATKKSKRKNRFKKNIISLAKGTRNSFYGKKKTKDKKKVESEAEKGLENKR